MVLAAEFTDAALVAWGVAVLAIGFVLGWILRPWLIRDRLRVEYEAKLATELTRAESAEALLATAAEELGASKAAFDTARADVIRAETGRAAAEARVSELEGAVADLGLEKAAGAERVGAEAAKVAELQASLAARDARVKELEAASVGESPQADHEDLANRLVEAERALVALQSDHERCAIEIAERDRRLAELDAGSHREAAAVVAAAPSAAAPATDAPEAAVLDSTVPDKDKATRKVAEIASRTRGQSARVVDNLKRIHGIGPKIDSLLKAMDITSFEQIARFEPDDIAYVAAALESFPDRIARDDWMSSAAALHAEKYGQSD